MANLTDPTKKKKTRSELDVQSGRTGSAARLVRNKKGHIEQHRDKDFAGMSGEEIRKIHAHKKKAQVGDKSFHGTVAPRVGGTAEKTGQATGTSSKKLIIRSIKNARKSDASPAAKKAAIKILRRRQ